MIISMLKGKVTKENWELLEQNFAKAIRHPPKGVLQCILSQSREDPSIWQIITIWLDEDTYLKYKKEGVTETCVELFCAAGSVPERMTFQVMRKFTLI